MLGINSAETGQNTSKINIIIKIALTIFPLWTLFCGPLWLLLCSADESGARSMAVHWPEPAALRSRSRKFQPTNKLANVAFSAVDRYQDRQSAVVCLLVTFQRSTAIKPKSQRSSACWSAVTRLLVTFQRSTAIKTGSQRSPACWSLFSGRPLSSPVDGQRPWLRSHFASSLSLVLTTAASGLMSASGSVHLKCPNPNCGALLVVGLAIDLPRKSRILRPAGTRDSPPQVGPCF